MRNHPLEPQDYASSVVAVPPLALFHDLRINAGANRASTLGLYPATEESTRTAFQKWRETKGR